MNCATKDKLERKYGTIDKCILCAIMNSVQNDMQQILDADSIPTPENYINILSTNAEFFIKYMKPSI